MCDYEYLNDQELMRLYSEEFKEYLANRQKYYDYLESLKYNFGKIYFKYGTMNSAKTTDLLTTAHKYREQGKNMMILCSDKDTRYEKGKIVSRTGLEEEALEISKNTHMGDLFYKIKDENIHVIFVDEIQFFDTWFIDFINQITLKLNVKVICYGLMQNSNGKLFNKTIMKLLPLCERLEEKIGICEFCGKKSTMILRYVDGKIVKDGEEISVGAEDKYVSVCRGHWYDPPMDKLEQLFKGEK